MNIFEEVIGEIFIEVIWRKFVRSCLYHSGVAVQLFLNVFRKHKIDPHKKVTNTLSGFALWIFIVTVTILLL